MFFLKKYNFISRFHRPPKPRDYEVRLSTINKIASTLGVSAKDLFEEVDRKE
jgi:hypothetical protein